MKMEMENNEDIISESFRNRDIATTQHGINFNVKNISTNIVKDLEISGEVGHKIISSKAAYINNVSDLNAMYLAFCKRLLGNNYEQRSVKTLGGALKEVMEDLFEVFEYDAMKIILSNDSVHHNMPKFERVIAKALDIYSRKLHHRQEMAKLRSYKHHLWELPEERAYPIESYDEQTEIKDHALLPFMQNKTAKMPEREFAAFLEENHNAIEWWYKNGDSGKAHYAISYLKATGEKGLFYVDFIIRMMNGAIFLFDTKKGLIDPDVVEKHNALIDYLNLPENKERNMHGGVIVKDRFGNWLYSPSHIYDSFELNNLANWDEFNPQLYV